MKFRVIILPSAKADLKRAAKWIRQYSREKAFSWLDGAYDAILSLSAHPARCAVLPLRDAFAEEIRQLLYGRGREEYRIIFIIEGESVVVLRVLHSAQDIISKLPKK